MSTSTTSALLASLSGSRTNDELNLAGAGGFGPDEEVVVLEARCSGLPDADMAGGADAYLRLSRAKEGGGWVQQFVTAPVAGGSALAFPPMVLGTSRLAGADPQARFLVEVIDKDLGSRTDDYIGFAEVSLAQLEKLPATFPLARPEGAEEVGSPAITFVSAKRMLGRDAPGGTTLLVTQVQAGVPSVGAGGSAGSTGTAAAPGASSAIGAHAAAASSSSSSAQVSATTAHPDLARTGTDAKTALERSKTSQALADAEARLAAERQLADELSRRSGAVPYADPGIPDAGMALKRSKTSEAKAEAERELEGRRALVDRLAAESKARATAENAELQAMGKIKKPIPDFKAPQ